MLTRPRTDADIAACVALMHQTHLQDGYPRYWRDDPAAFLRDAAETAAWVVEDDDGTLLGHVALRNAADDVVLPAAQRATGVGAARLTVVSRLLVSPAARRRGVGRQLLETATTAAHAAGQRPVLDVVQVDAAPVGLYESAGWQRLEAVTLPIEGHPSLLLWVYLGPPPPAR